MVTCGIGGPESGLDDAVADVGRVRREVLGSEQQATGSSAAPEGSGYASRWHVVCSPVLAVVSPRSVKRASTRGAESKEAEAVQPAHDREKERTRAPTGTQRGGSERAECSMELQLHRACVRVCACVCV